MCVEVVEGSGGSTTARDRKSTRLNSSHGYISYAVFCLQNKYLSNHISRAEPQFFVCMLHHAEYQSRNTGRLRKRRAEPFVMRRSLVGLDFLHRVSAAVF